MHGVDQILNQIVDALIYLVDAMTELFKHRMWIA
jgi:hypothetical protein